VSCPICEKRKIRPLLPRQGRKDLRRLLRHRARSHDRLPLRLLLSRRGTPLRRRASALPAREHAAARRKNPSGYRLHRRACAAHPNAAGPGRELRTRYELAAFFRERALVLCSPTWGRCGITESLRIAAVAAESGVPVVPHLSIAMGPQIAAAIHFAAAIPNCELLEYNRMCWKCEPVLSEPLECRGGDTPCRSGPLGCNLTYL